jgi:hypothetical protein
MMRFYLKVFELILGQASYLSNNVCTFFNGFSADRSFAQNNRRVAGNINDGGSLAAISLPSVDNRINFISDLLDYF